MKHICPVCKNTIDFIVLIPGDDPSKWPKDTKFGACPTCNTKVRLRDNLTLKELMEDE